MFHQIVLVLNMNYIVKGSFKYAGSFAAIFRTLFDFFFSIIGKIILKFLHHIYSLLLAVNSCVNSSFFYLESLRTNYKTEKLSDETLIKSEVVFFQKIPQHIALIVSSESPSYKDFVRIIKWSIAAGVSHVSFYDHHNGIDSEELFEYICKHGKQYIPAIRWGKSFPEDIKRRSKSHINGYSWKPIVSIHVVRSSHWEEQVFDSIHELKEDSSCDRIDVKLIDSVFRKKFLAPDPDLCLVPGNHLSFFGFPPWHLRITQIQEISTHHNISLRCFLDMLWKYNKCEQRYGK